MGFRSYWHHSKGNHRPYTCEEIISIIFSQNVSYCGSDANFCIENVSKHHADCKISCTGLHAVVWYLENDPDKQKFDQKLVQMTSEYHQYLNNYAENLVYNSSSESLSKFF